MGKLFNSTDKDINLDNDDFEELKRRSYSQFGWPKVNIECDDSSFSYIIKKGLMHLSTYVPKIVYEAVSIYAHQSEYVLDRFHLSKYVKKARAHLPHITHSLWNYINRLEKENVRELF